MFYFSVFDGGFTVTGGNVRIGVSRTSRTRPTAPVAVPVPTASSSIPGFSPSMPVQSAPITWPNGNMWPANQSGQPWPNQPSPSAWPSNGPIYPNGQTYNPYPIQAPNVYPNLAPNNVHPGQQPYSVYVGQPPYTTATIAWPMPAVPTAYPTNAAYNYPGQNVMGAYSYAPYAPQAGGPAPFNSAAPAAAPMVPTVHNF